jgi:hypothetical protein
MEHTPSSEANSTLNYSRTSPPFITTFAWLYTWWAYSYVLIKFFTRTLEIPAASASLLSLVLGSSFTKL